VAELSPGCQIVHNVLLRVMQCWLSDMIKICLCAEYIIGVCDK